MALSASFWDCCSGRTRENKVFLPSHAGVGSVTAPTGAGNVTMEAGIGSFSAEGGTWSLAKEAAPAQDRMTESSGGSTGAETGEGSAAAESGAACLAAEGGDEDTSTSKSSGDASNAAANGDSPKAETAGGDVTAEVDCGESAATEPQPGCATVDSSLDELAVEVGMQSQQAETNAASRVVYEEATLECAGGYATAAESSGAEEAARAEGAAASSQRRGDPRVAPPPARARSPTSRTRTPPRKGPSRKKSFEAEDGPLAALKRMQVGNLRRILEELEANGHKCSCWIWWVFPTDKPGNADHARTYVTTRTALQLFDGSDRERLWREVMVKICDLVEEGGMRVLPSIDWGRIHFFLKFWRSLPGCPPWMGEAVARLSAYDWPMY